MSPAKIPNATPIRNQPASPISLTTVIAVIFFLLHVVGVADIADIDLSRRPYGVEGGPISTPVAPEAFHRMERRVRVRYTTAQVAETPAAIQRMVITASITFPPTKT
jgi:hypothetical protein